MWESAVEWFVFTFLNIPKDNVLGGAIAFFIADYIKIIVMLFAIVFIVAVIRSFILPARIKAILSKRSEYIGNALAASFGIITPFCSCSAVPLFIGFIETGIPLGVTFSFLIASPLINEVAIGILWASFGWKITAIYIGSGLLIAILGGIVLGRLGLEKWLEDSVVRVHAAQAADGGTAGSGVIKFSWETRLRMSWAYTIDLVKKIAPYIAIGVGIGALIHGYAPADLVAKVAAKSNPLAVPVAVAIGVPLYSNAAGIIPVVTALIGKGVPLGTALAFMMAVTALSLPEAIILRKVLKIPLLVTFFGIIALAIVFTGYLFNLII